MQQSAPHLVTLKRRLHNGARGISNALFGRDLTNRSQAVRRGYLAVRWVYERLSPAHRRWRVFDRVHPDAPWFAQDAIPFMESLIQPGWKAFEWGAGRSTLWLARQGVAIDSVEGRRDWAELVVRQLKAENLDDRAKVRLVEVPAEFNVATDIVAAYANAILEHPPQAFDLVVVDGHFRSACLAAIGDRIKPGGLLVVDNADTAEVAPVLRGIERYLIGGFDNGIWRTHIYRVPSEGLPSLT